MKLQKKILIQSLAIAGVCVSMASFVVEAASPAPDSSGPVKPAPKETSEPPAPPPAAEPPLPPPPPVTPAPPPPGAQPSGFPPNPVNPDRPDPTPSGATDPHHGGTGDPGTSGSGDSSADNGATGGTNSTGTVTEDKDKGTSTSNKAEADSHNKDNTSNSDATSATTENTPKGDGVTGKDTTEEKQTGKQDEGKEDSSASSAETDAGSHAGAENPKGLSDGSTNTSSSATVETPKKVVQPVNTNSMVPFAFAERDALLVSYDMIGTYFERQGRVIDAQHDKSAWGRFIVSLPTVKARHQAGTYTSTLLGGQVGVDLWHTFNRHAGVSLALLSGDDELDNLASSVVANNSLGRLNNMDITSRYIGLGAYFGADHLSHNAYYDIVVQYVMGQQKHQMVKLKSKGWHISAETGLQVAQWNNLSVDLSGQLIYSNVSFSKAESAHVKGLRAFGNVQLNYDTHTAFKPFVKVGVYTDLIKPTYHKVQFDRAGWQIGFGADAALSDTSQLYLKLNYRRSFGGLEQGFKGIIGYKKAF